MIPMESDGLWPWPTMLTYVDNGDTKRIEVHWTAIEQLWHSYEQLDARWMQTCSSTMVNNGAVSEVEPVELEGVEAAMSSNDGTLKSTLIPRPKLLGIYIFCIF